MKTVPLIYVLAPLPKVLCNCAEAWGLSLSPAHCYCSLMRSVGPVSKLHHCYCGLMRSMGPVSKPHHCYCSLMRSMGPVPTAPQLLLLGRHPDDASYYDVIAAVSVIGIGTASDMSWKSRLSWSWNATDVWPWKIEENW